MGPNPPLEGSSKKGCSSQKRNCSRFLETRVVVLASVCCVNVAEWEFSTATDKGDAGGTGKDFFKLKERDFLGVGGKFFRIEASCVGLLVLIA